ncbi:hypothetical protein HYN59_16135 [Flavobacterium album]|uniref:DOMON domain-containing protein n=1 Tax=Flavobacterium album TaxID=2175091 RepID=A0A2S1R1J0_9FLAO|nr:T9SS type A sorting domain-containing protein [Flavobacterium album]AWH86540.1 hypothetical protein HYN59_16135 [Flavobacterium album]
MKTKAPLILLLLCAVISTAYSQKETPLTSLGGSMSIKLRMEQMPYPLLTLTLTGPATKWFSVGFHATTMASNTDCVVYSTSFTDRKLPGGHNAPVTDAVNDWTVVSNTVAGTVRTIVATRPLSTGDSNDYTFLYSAASINIIWAYASTNTTTVTNHGNNYGTANLAFSTVLGNDEFTDPLKDVFVYPVPANGKLFVSNKAALPIDTITIYNTAAQVVTSLSPGNPNDLSIDISSLAAGVYFVEIVSGKESTVKKIQVN